MAGSRLIFRVDSHGQTSRPEIKIIILAGGNLEVVLQGAPEGNRREHQYDGRLHPAFDQLDGRLASLGVSDEIVSAVLESDQMDSDRRRLSLDGGKPRNTFRVESNFFRNSYRNSYRNPDLGYRLFKYLVLFLTLLMPPKVFYHLRHWYSERNLRRIRERIVRAPVADPEGHGTKS